MAARPPPRPNGPLQWPASSTRRSPVHFSPDAVEDADARCPVCGEAVAAEVAVACSNCSAPHHPDCWEYGGGCSMFGCGSQVNIDFKAIQESLKGHELTINESTKAPVRWDAVSQGLVRKFQTRAKDLPATLTAGLGGAAFSVAAYLLLHPAVGSPDRLYTAIFLTGGLYGLLSPFLAPSQHRYPGRLALAGLASFTGVFMLGEFLNVSGSWAMALVVPLFFSAFLFASSGAEKLAGARTWAAEKLGRAALPVRLAISWVLAVGLMLLTLALDRGWGLPSSQILGEIAIWGLMAVGTVGPALERGKAGYRASLPEETL